MSDMVRCLTCAAAYIGSRCPYCSNPGWFGNGSYNTKRQTLIEYLKVKTEEADWHAVSDAANDLRVLEAIHGRSYS